MLPIIDNSLAREAMLISVQENPYRKLREWLETLDKEQLRVVAELIINAPELELDALRKWAKIEQARMPKMG